MASTDKTTQAAPTLEQLLAAMNAQSEAKAVTSAFVSAKSLAESGAKFRFSKIETATNKKFAKEVIRFGIVLENGTEQTLELTPTKDRMTMVNHAAAFIGAAGSTQLVEVPLANGKYTYKFGKK